MKKNIPIPTLHLFPILDKMLIELLLSLTDDEWNAQTVAKLWKVKDVASHMLDINLRNLSTSRDAFFGEKPENINSYDDLVSFLNQLNLNWTKATKRLSPTILIQLLEMTGKQYTEHLKILKPFDYAVFSVAWAGQDVSENWFHIAREYTEKFLHQQQIRDAVGKPGLMTKELFHPLLETFMFAFPLTYKDVSAENNTVVALIVATEIGGQWFIVKNENGWELSKHIEQKPDASVTIDPHIAWKLFSKSITPAQALEKVEITGNMELGKRALQMVAVMA